MHLKASPPQVKPNAYEMPTTCPYGCGSQHYRRHSMKGERKAIRDIGYAEVRSYRYECVRCGRTFRVYPEGVSPGAQQSKRLQAMTVILYVLGLSYGAVEDFTAAIGCGVSKTTVYNNVQAAGGVARQKQRHDVQEGGKRAVIGVDGTYMKVHGKSVGVEVVVDDKSGQLLGLEIVTGESYDEIIGVIKRVSEQVEAEVLVSDGHGAYNDVVDDIGAEHQICQSHGKRNVDDSAKSLDKHLEHPEPLPEGVTLTPEQAREDLERMQQVIRERPQDGEEQLAAMYDRYKDVPAPESKQRHSVWYRLRMMVTRPWERWWKFTLDQRRDDLDGTNNAAERLIGWWIKERYRTMRGYKREESIKNVVTLTAQSLAVYEAIVADDALSAIQKWTRAVQVIGDWKIERKVELLALARVMQADENVLLRHKLATQAAQVTTPELAKIIAQGIAEGVFETDYPEETAEIVHAISTAFSGTITGILLNPDGYDDPEALVRRKIEALQTATERVLGAAPGSLPVIDKQTLCAWFEK